MMAAGGVGSEDRTAMATNTCPGCGPVEAHLSSRYCLRHLKEFLAQVLEIPPVRKAA